MINRLKKFLFLTKHVERRKCLKLSSVTISLKSDFGGDDTQYAYFEFIGKPRWSEEAYCLMLYRDYEENEVVLMTNPAKEQDNCDPGHFHIQLYRNSLHLSLPKNVTQNHADLFEDYEIGFELTDVEFERLTETLSSIIELQGQLDISSG